MKEITKPNLIFLFIFSLIIIIGCKKEEPEVIPDPTVEVTVPKIDSISANKAEIPFGGTEPAILTVHCSGGGTLTYEWDVDFGDLIPQNSDASIIHFNASPCCIGEKVVRCEATNELGVVKDSIYITILEP